MKARDKVVLLSNASTAAIRAATVAELPVKHLRTESNRPVATLTAAVVGELVDPLSKARVKSKLVLTPESAAVRGGPATFKIKLPASDWAELPVGHYFGGTLRIAGPGKGNEATIRLEVEKRPYTVQAPGAAFSFDLSARRKKRTEGKVKVKLQTTLGTQEPIWLSTRPGRTEKPKAETELPLVPAGKEGKATTVRVRGLGTPVLLHGGKGTLTLSVARPDSLAVGTYKADLYVVGKSIEPALKIPVEVVRRRFRLDAAAVVAFDFSGQPKQPVPGSVEGLLLATELDTDEMVTLTPAAAADALLLKSKTTPGKSISMKAAGLGKSVSVWSRGSRQPAAKLALSLFTDKPVDPGLYEAKLFLRGQAVHEREVIIRVKVDQPRVLREDEGKRLTPIETLDLVALAGAPLRCKLAFGSSLDSDKYFSGLGAQLKGKVPDKLIVFRQPQRDDRLALDLKVEPTDNGDRLTLGMDRLPQALRER